MCTYLHIEYKHYFRFKILLQYGNYTNWNFLLKFCEQVDYHWVDRADFIWKPTCHLIVQWRNLNFDPISFPRETLEYIQRLWVNHRISVNPFSRVRFLGCSLLPHLGTRISQTWCLCFIWLPTCLISKEGYERGSRQWKMRRYKHPAITRDHVSVLTFPINLINQHIGLVFGLSVPLAFGICFVYMIWSFQGTVTYSFHSRIG